MNLFDNPVGHPWEMLFILIILILLRPSKQKSLPKEEIRSSTDRYKAMRIIEKAKNKHK